MATSHSRLQFEEDVLNQQVLLQCVSCQSRHTADEHPDQGVICSVHEAWACSTCSKRQHKQRCPICAREEERMRGRQERPFSSGMAATSLSREMACFLFGLDSSGCPLAMQLEAFGAFTVNKLAYFLFLTCLWLTLSRSQLIQSQHPLASS